MRRPSATPRRDIGGVALLAVVTALWGTTFVVIKGTVAEISPAALVLARFAIGAVVLTLLVPRRSLPGRAGLELGFWLWLGYATQAHGLQFTTASRSAFITSVSVVLVPVLAALAGRHVRRTAFASALVAVLGVGLLSFDGAPPNAGDLWTLVTAGSYAVFVLRLEAHAAREHALPLAAAQLWGVVPFAAAMVAVDVVVLGAETGLGSRVGLPGVLYLALVATALTTWLQTEGQRRVAAPEAGVLYSMEPVWAALFAALVLGERLGPSGWVGAAAIVGAVLLSQVSLARG